MARWFRTGVVMAAGLVAGVGPLAVPASGQVRERDVTITGPRGRTIQRSMESVRGPGFLERETTIRRPGGTYQSDLMIRRQPGFAPRGGFIPRGGPGWGPGWWGPRPLVINNGGGSGLLDFGIGAGLGTGLGLLMGSALSSPPPPAVVYTPPPAVYAPPSGVVYVPPQPYQPAPPPTQVVDPVASAAARLQSHHANSRRDGAITLGRLRDPRAIPALVDRLKNDTSKDVRIASATALGEIGDPQAAIVLERATIYDKRQDVRDAAAAALARMPRPEPALSQASGGGAVGLSDPNPSATVPAIEPIERVPPPPTPADVPRR